MRFRPFQLATDSDISHLRRNLGGAFEPALALTGATMTSFASASTVRVSERPPGANAVWMRSLIDVPVGVVMSGTDLGCAWWNASTAASGVRLAVRTSPVRLDRAYGIGVALLGPPSLLRPGERVIAAAARPRWPPTPARGRDCEDRRQFSGSSAA